MSLTDLPKHWKMVRFGDVTTFTKKPRGLRYSEYNEIPFVPMELIPIAKLSSEEFTLKTNDELKSGTYFEPGDILLPKITPSFENGKQCIIKELPIPFGIATTEVIPIHEVVGVSNKYYLFYYLLLPNVRTLLAGKMQGTTGRQRLNKETLVNLEIPFPPLPEQRAIAHVLQTIQEAKTARQRELALERERKAALMDYLFSYGTKDEPRKQTEIGEIPESWEVVEFAKTVKIAGGQVDPRQEPYRSMIHVGPENIESGTGKLVATNTNADLKIRSGNYYFKAGEILYSKIRPYLNKAALPYFEGTCSADVYPLRPCKEHFERKFLFQFLLSRQFNMQAISHQNRTGIPKINRVQLGSIFLLEPPLPEQTQIAEVLCAFDTKIIALEQETERLDELFHAMLDELMTGKISAVSLVDAELPN